MKIKVRLFGTLSQSYPGYEAQEGVEVELPQGAKVGDLLSRLGVSDGNRAVVAAESIIRSPTDDLVEGAVVRVLQAVYGG